MNNNQRFLKPAILKKNIGAARISKAGFPKVGRSAAKIASGPSIMEQSQMYWGKLWVGNRS
jgi:hypothetical protein